MFKEEEKERTRKYSWDLYIVPYATSSSGSSWTSTKTCNAVLWAIEILKMNQPRVKTRSIQTNITMLKPYLKRAPWTETYFCRKVKNREFVRGERLYLLYTMLNTRCLYKGVGRGVLVNDDEDLWRVTTFGF